MAVSNNITALLNFIALMCSIPIISAGIWLASKPDNECIRWLRWPLVFLGLAFLLVTLTGFVGAYWKKEGLLGLYLVCMFMLIVLLLVLLVLAFVVTRHGGAYSAPDGAYAFREYRLQGFSSWLRNHITSDDNWGGIRACLAESQICPKLSRKYIAAADFFAAHLSPIESGCCKPPMICGYQYSSPTTWNGAANVAADGDCAIWSNDPGQLCYNCESCKAGLLGNLRQEWRKANVILIVTVVVLICVYLVACSAYKNAQTEELFRKYKQGWA
ncbi:tetraspanin2 [Perilla frutescens var. hirtella]|uniref:Tetraspanin2 n=1 Tax=Perilla frutescens var. hirtella TaxID=608512 RepID=A0AAD4J7H0_PERFH|nr:tetraspanin2 [Perilla frutescens var. hirtella]KAH6817166.1 tetraspanin2 [Perilla frutescens var. frutescens]KAH6828569.1 tetraspanin2 [Perilla frutescens var. hirtella]